jgi:hypothetical protein
MQYHGAQYDTQYDLACFWFVVMKEGGILGIPNDTNK